MKTLIPAAIIFVIMLVSCTEDKKNPDGSFTRVPEKKFERNLAITPQNAYSDLFLDSVEVEKFIVNQKLSDSLADGFRMFYNLRNFQFAWFSSDGVTEQTLSFRSLYDYDKDSTVSRKSLDNILDDILTQDSLTEIKPDARITKTEMLLTWRFINYISRKYTADQARETALVQMVPAQKATPLAMAEEVLAGKRNQLES